MDTSQVLDDRSSLIGSTNNLPVSPRTLIGSKFNRARVLWIGVPRWICGGGAVEHSGACGACGFMWMSFACILICWSYFSLGVFWVFLGWIFLLFAVKC